MLKCDGVRGAGVLKEGKRTAANMMEHIREHPWAQSISDKESDLEFRIYFQSLDTFCLEKASFLSFSFCILLLVALKLACPLALFLNRLRACS